jgi:cation:H+ antiporter
MNVYLWFLVFAVSLLVLIKASDYFIESAEKVGLHIGLPSFVVGVVIIGFGTSLPELVSSILGVISGAPEIVAGNVLGSNITNIFLIVGIAAFLSGNFEIKYDLLATELPFLFSVVALLSFMISDGSFSFVEAIFFTALLIIYLAKAFGSKDDATEDSSETKEEFKKIYYLYLIISPLFIFIGAKYTVDSVIEISNILNIAKEAIALSAVAFGTSLPEILVTIAAAKRGNADMAIGNVVGSNIFNILAVMGVSRFFGEIPISPQLIQSTMPLHIAATFIFIIIIIDKKVNRWEGLLLLSFYLYFILNTFHWI